MRGRDVLAAEAAAGAGDAGSARGAGGGACRLAPGAPPPTPALRPSGLSRPQQLVLLQGVARLPCLPAYAGGDGGDGGVVLDRVLLAKGRKGWWATLVGRARAQRVVRRARRTGGSASQRLGASLSDSGAYALAARLRGALPGGATLTATAEAQTLDDVPRLRLPSGARAALEALLPRELSAIARDRPSSAPRPTPRLHAALRRAAGGGRAELYAEGASNMRVLDGCGGYADVGAVLSAGVATRRGTGPVSACAGVVAMRGIGETGSTAARGNGLTSLSALTATPGVTAGVTLGAVASAPLPEGVLPPALGDFGTGETALPACAKGLASLRVRAHFGAFERLFGDWSSLQARLDLGSSALGVDAKPKGARSAALALSATQQLVGPLRLRADATVGLDSRAAARSRRAGGPTLRDRVIDGAFALDCAVVPGGAARAVLWWSPVRNEAMAEVRLLEI
eukprot:PRCOL_00005378-RA